jgi:LPS O-antigen subunit length determinant protein (WzzB/FepE family)
MKRFRFRLERVLQWQIKVCQLKENDVRLSVVAVSEADQRIEQLRAASMAAEQDSLNHAALTSADLTALGRFRIRVIKDREALAALKARLLETLQRHRENLTAERRRLRLLEKLRARSLDEYAFAADRESEELATECHLSKWVSQALQRQSGFEGFGKQASPE